MKVFTEVLAVDTFLAQGAVAIGNFDGVHIAHQALIKKASELAGVKNAGVLTFSPHPSGILRPKNHFFCLTNNNQKTQLITQAGADALVSLSADKKLLSMSPENFIEEILVKALKISHVVVGDDFFFGENAQGNTNLLHKYGEKYGFKTYVLEAIMVKGQRCSSSAIRKFLEFGQLKAAQAMLGRPYSLMGKVVSHQKKGKLLGFATANLSPKNFYLKRGVYACITRILGQEDYVSVCNVGFRPTLSESEELVVESHLIDQNLDLFGQNIEIFFLEYLREEKKFSSILKLQEQVKKDVEMVKAMSLSKLSC